MKTLVLGGNGFIGSHLVDRLVREGHEVRVFDRNPERYRKPLNGVAYHLQDFRNHAALAYAVEHVDMVFHLISTTTPKTSNEDPEFDVTSNLVETISLLKLCVEKKVKKLIYLSSGGAVYGKPSSLPVHEDDPLDPQSSYGVTKLAVEKFIQIFSRLYGLNFVIIRPSNPYGERQNPNNNQGVIAVFLGKVAKKQVIDIWGDGNAVKDYIYIDDLIDGIYRASFYSNENVVFNIGTGAGISINEIVKIISTITDRKIALNYTPVKSFDIQHIYLDVTRAMTLLSWEPRTSINEGIFRTWQFIISKEK